MSQPPMPWWMMIGAAILAQIAFGLLMSFAFGGEITARRNREARDNLNKKV